jgi:hypothetical protein
MKDGYQIRCKKLIFAQHMLLRPTALNDRGVCHWGGGGGQYGPAAKYFIWVQYGQQCRSCATRDKRVKLLTRFIRLFFYHPVVIFLF